jgi:hypothetical protein
VEEFGMTKKLRENFGKEAAAIQQFIMTRPRKSLQINN